MVVQELIDKLKEFPSQARVLVRGYESGFDNIEEILFQDVIYYPDNAWYDGPYQVPVHYNEGPGFEQITAVTLH